MRALKRTLTVWLAVGLLLAATAMSAVALVRSDDDARPAPVASSWAWPPCQEDEVLVFRGDFPAQGGYVCAPLDDLCQAAAEARLDGLGGP